MQLPNDKMLSKNQSTLDSDDQLERLIPSRPLKRSFSISGHRTSISLETAFWKALREIATGKGLSLSALVAEIDRERGEAGLSGAVRVYVLDYYRTLNTKHANAKS